jgi:hypothetical protein
LKKISVNQSKGAFKRGALFNAKKTRQQSMSPKAIKTQLNAVISDIETQENAISVAAEYFQRDGEDRVSDAFNSIVVTCAAIRAIFLAVWQRIGRNSDTSSFDVFVMPVSAKGKQTDGFATRFNRTSKSLEMVAKAYNEVGETRMGELVNRLSGQFAIAASEVKAMERRERSSDRIGSRNPDSRVLSGSRRFVELEVEDQPEGAVTDIHNWRNNQNLWDTTASKFRQKTEDKQLVC